MGILVSKIVPGASKRKTGQLLRGGKHATVGLKLRQEFLSGHLQGGYHAA